MLTWAVSGGVAGWGMDSASDELGYCEISNDLVEEQYVKILVGVIHLSRVESCCWI